MPARPRHEAAAETKEAPLRLGNGAPWVRVASDSRDPLLRAAADAAQSVFIELGYARTTMDSIARAAGASRKTLYARYANKAEMLTAVVNRLLDAALAPHEAPPAAEPAPREPRALLLQLSHELSSSRPRPISPASTA